ncbi:site-specific DNA-methyltransferase [Staphylococcus saprophyticus]|uniref:site-specific DNA-methyltransferase n=1 Tax=Staphylococcus saprophyticus TaxID=29385 RepID=UPI0034DCC5DD
MSNKPEKINLADIYSRKVDENLLNELRELFAKAEEQKERYDFTWNGKAKAYFEAASPTIKTLSPQPEESVNFENSENLFITGDNLEALKLLQESYLGKVKVVYVDPPYNTGTNMIYSNDYSISTDEYLQETGEVRDGYKLVSNPKTSGRHHSLWLSMIYPRLKIARNLLTDDGFMVLSMDDSEIENLIKIADEIFGEENRIGIVTVVHKPEGRNQEKFFGTSNEYALFYAKDKNKAEFNNVILDTEKLSEYKYRDSRGRYKKKDFIRRADGKYATREAKPNFWYPIYVSPDRNSVSIDKIEGFDAVYPVINNGIERTWKTLPQTFMELYNNDNIDIDEKDGKLIISEKMRENQVFKTHWIKKEYHAYHFGTKIIDELLKEKTFDFPKSLYLMIDIFKITTKKDDIVLDIFAGSGTSAHALMTLNKEDDLNRKFILVQLDEKIDKKSNAYHTNYKTIDQISRERIRRAAIKLGDSSGFRTLKVDNSKLQDNIFKSAGELEQEQLLMDIDNQSDKRSDYELLYDVLIDGAFEYNRQITIESLNDEKIIKYDYLGELSGIVAYFGKNITEELTRKIANLKPLIVVFRESSFDMSAQKVNVMEQFRIISPDTKVKVI